MGQKRAAGAAFPWAKFGFDAPAVYDFGAILVQTFP
jgi:hypothetical protein